MPSLSEHAKRSMKRTGDDNMELNTWLNGDQLGLLQRLRRHLQIKKYSRYVEGRWGEKGLKEYRNHLGDDFRAFITTHGFTSWRELARKNNQKRGEMSDE